MNTPTMETTWDCVDYDDEEQEQHTVNYDSFLDIGMVTLPMPTMTTPLPSPKSTRRRSPSTLTTSSNSSNGETNNVHRRKDMTTTVSTETIANAVKTGEDIITAYKNASKSAGKNDRIYGWRSFQDFTTTKGINELNAYIDECMPELTCVQPINKGTGRQTIANKRYVTFYSTSWFKYKTPLNRVLHEMPVIEAEYVDHIITDCPMFKDAVILLGEDETYIDSSNADTIIEIIRQNIINHKYTTWVKQHAQWYTTYYRRML